jgi:Family of unknown function (DUF6370)
MKKIITLFIVLICFSVVAQETKEQPKKQIVEASCGQCQFGMEGKACDLAVLLDGKSYFVDGTHIDQHGDAHAADGFCAKVRKAEVVGEIVDNRFKVTYFKLLPYTK